MNGVSDAPLDEWYGVSTDAAGWVVRIDLAAQWDNEARQYVSHDLRRELPGELTSPTEPTGLHLGHNSLAGPIPPELGTSSRWNGWTSVTTDGWSIRARALPLPQGWLGPVGPVSVHGMIRSLALVSGKGGVGKTTLPAPSRRPKLRKC